MSFSGSVRAFFLRYFDFRGRSSRSEFWWAVLFTYLASIAAGIVDRASGYPVLNPLLGLAFLIPTFSLQVRRLHDTGRTGWWLVIIPAVVLALMFAALAAFGTPGVRGGQAFLMLAFFSLAAISGYGILLVWNCLRGTLGPNRFGPDPLSAA